MSIQAVVSRALNGYSDVSVKTRERVFAAAKALNYSPHPVAHRLATGKTGVIAIINSERPHSVAEGSAGPLYSGAAQVMREHGYFTVSISIPTGDQEMPELTRLLAGRLFDGLVLTRTRTQDSRVSLLQERKIPFVTHGRTTDNAPHAWVDTDNTGAFELATQALIERGHQRIAFINGMPHMTFAQLREEGFRKALAAAGLSEADCPVHYTELSGAAGEHVANHLLKQPHRPSAILCATDTLAMGAMKALKDARLRAGRDISIIGYGNTEAGQFTDPALSSIDHSIINNGRDVANLLLRVMAGENPMSLNMIQTPKLIIRESVGAAALV
jgi:LacI family transcriptional regulator